MSTITVPPNDKGMSGPVMFFFDACRELARANRIHPAFRSVHEGYAVILEEVDELWDEVRKRDRDPERIRAECVQIAAMCGKLVEYLEAQDG